jgi:hypothetical protein
MFIKRKVNMNSTLVEHKTQLGYNILISMHKKPKLLCRSFVLLAVHQANPQAMVVECIQ